MRIAQPRVMVIQGTGLLFFVLILAIISALGIPVISTLAKWTLIAIAIGTIVLFLVLMLSFFGLYLILKKVKAPYSTFEKEHQKKEKKEKTEKYTPAKGEVVIDANIKEKKISLKRKKKDKDS